jgi:Ferritin-like domain
MLRPMDTKAIPRHGATSRRQFLALGAVAAAGGVIATPASAALPIPAPQGDDVGYLSFGAVAELTSLAWYDRARTVSGFSAGERRRLASAATAKRGHIARINRALGADAVAPDDFAADFPAAALRSRAGAIALGRKLEGLLVGVYLNGAAFARDSATRLLLGRLLAYDAQQLAWLRGLTGGPAGAGLPTPATLEAAGAALDGLVTTPTFTNP